MSTFCTNLQFRMYSLRLYQCIHTIHYRNNPSYLVLVQESGDLTAQGDGFFLQPLQVLHPVCISLCHFLTFLAQGAAQSVRAATQRLQSAQNMARIKMNNTTNGTHIIAIHANAQINATQVDNMYTIKT